MLQSSLVVNLSDFAGDEFGIVTVAVAGTSASVFVFARSGDELCSDSVAVDAGDEVNGGETTLGEAAAALGGVVCCGVGVLERGGAPTFRCCAFRFGLRWGGE